MQDPLLVVDQRNAMLKSLKSAISELERLQQHSQSGLLLARQLPIGLGGQIHGRIEAYRLGLALGRTTIFTRPDDPPYTQSFLPSSQLRPTSSALAAAEPVDLEREQSTAVILLDPTMKALRTAEFEAALARRMEERLGQRIPDPRALRGAIFNWMKLTEDTKRYCAEQNARLGVTEETLGVHFRRGDKSSESAFVPASALNSHVAELCHLYGFSSVFVSSDSPMAFREIKVPTGIRLIFDVEEKRYNNANHKMISRSSHLAEQETKTAIKNIFLLSSCGGLIGQDNAHFAEIAGSAIYARTGSLDKVRLVDGRMVEKSIPVLRLYFNLKLKARAFARKLLPGLTAAEKMKRISQLTPENDA